MFVFLLFGFPPESNFLRFVRWFFLRRKSGDFNRHFLLTYMPRSAGLLRRCHPSIPPSSSTPKQRQTFAFLGFGVHLFSHLVLFFPSCCAYKLFAFSGKVFFPGDEEEKRGTSARTKRGKKKKAKQVWTSSRR
ncbi:hypothetical protein CSUI_009165 [Cystoisospora suis]|uniref:Uncharacterized protein n=1 Tax=Cystoisospora suis TaxID=483139 RepID=A0A2C6KKS2_9APIC|nr:hypothetical protein CSUI_009165 [Cystoisospora suis]